MTQKRNDPENAPVKGARDNARQAQKDTSQGAKPTPNEAGPDEAEQARAERIAMLKQVEELKKVRLQKQINALEAEAKEDEDDDEDDDDDVELSEEVSTSRSRPPAGPAALRGRHVFAMTSFLLFVVLPTLFAGWYMYERATDRYVSYMGFSVRTEETGSAFELLGGVAELSGSSSSDTDILYRFIESQQLVSAVNARVDLEKIWAHDNTDADPFFSYKPGGTIEDITEYWNSMVDVFADSGTGLIDLKVQAFNPDDAQLLAEVVFDESLQMINRLSTLSREDATGYAREELEQTVERLKEARTALTQFRNRTQIIDPSASISSQMGILTSLQTELANTLIELDLLAQTTTDNDPRVIQTRQRIEVIEARIVEEQTKFGQGTDGGSGSDTAFASLIGEYEELAVDLQFAEQSYQAARAALDAAINEARRQSRYLAAHIQPTLPQAPERPYRLITVALFGLFSFLTWAILLLAGYSLRDRR